MKIGKKFFTALIFTSVSIIIYSYSTGITGVTLKGNSPGCICHNPEPSTNVNVFINGPDELLPGETAQYSITISGGPLARAGTNIAASSGILETVNSNLQKIGDELTHQLPKAPVNNSVIFEFNYTAPEEPGNVILYANGNSVNFNGNNTGDQWNFAPNKIIEITAPVPVELENFTAEVVDKNILIKWNTITETNNYGFTIERKNSSLSYQATWDEIGFLKGAGNSLQKQEYFFEDKNLTAGIFRYRIKQLDLNGTFKYYNLERDISLSPNNFSLNQNFPNPFNPMTNIEYNLPVNANVQLIVYNSLGKEVSELINEFKEGGRYKYQFSADGLSSGVYYYKLNIVSLDNKNIFTNTKKMLIVK